MDLNIRKMTNHPPSLRNIQYMQWPGFSFYSLLALAVVGLHFRARNRQGLSLKYRTGLGNGRIIGKDYTNRQSMKQRTPPENTAAMYSVLPQQMPGE